MSALGEKFKQSNKDFGLVLSLILVVLVQHFCQPETELKDVRVISCVSWTVFMQPKIYELHEGADFDF